MNETQRNIKRYRAALPGLRERIVASAMLLVISLSMMVSASFAWYTISTAPEVSAINTTIAANGNLEIALVGPEGDKPETSQVGDSSAADGNLVRSNITWGNLVNLSDASYGLSEISLRPAILSGYNMTRAPLYGAAYGADGRVEKISETYEYTTYTDFGAGNVYFAGGDKMKHGVRAVASVKYENATGQSFETQIMEKVNDAYQKTLSLYSDIVDNKTDVGGLNSMDALTLLLKIYVDEQAARKLDNVNYKADYAGVVYYMYNLVNAFCTINDTEGEALCHLANLVAYKADTVDAETLFANIDAVVAAYKAGTLKNTYKVELASLEDGVGRYVINRDDIYEARDLLSKYNTEAYKPSNSPSDVYWDDIKTAVALLVNIDTATIAEKGGEPTAIGNISSLGTAALAQMVMGANKNNPVDVVIKDGTLADTEQRLGSLLSGTQMVIHVNIEKGVPLIEKYEGDVYANVSTDATTNNPPYNNYLSYYDREQAAAGSFTAQGDAVAKETYGMAMDLWLRTNTEGVNLVLEGNVETIDEQATCVARDGSTVGVWTASFEDRQWELYKLTEEQTDEQGNTTQVTNWYNAATHVLVKTDAEMTEAGITPEPKYIQIVTGFSGENRIWENFISMVGDGVIPEESTTQGAGSCYVFYANPTDQTRILELLKSFTVKFLDEKGNELATAVLDTEHAYAINGKVTVPLKLSDSKTTYTDENGFEQLSILAMEKNEETWITALVYLDGMRLTNEQVLSAGEIEGRLNLQFGSSLSLTAGTNEDLLYDSRSIEAKATFESQVSTNENSPIRLDYDGTDKIVTVELTVDGDQPNSISAFFLRKISNTQGSRMESQEFKQVEGTNAWTANFDLSKPGEYVMMSVIADGVEYRLEKTIDNEVQTNYPTVIIDGLGITSVNIKYDTGNGIGQGTGTILTADTYVDVDVTVKIDATPELMPNQVRAIFRDTDGKDYTAILSYANGSWSGTARIDKSGSYTLTYVVMDGDYEDLFEEYPDNFHPTVMVNLGLAAEVGCLNLAEVPTEFTGTSPLYMTVKILDDSDNEMRGMSGVKLVYHSAASKLVENGMYADMVWVPSGTEITMANGKTWTSDGCYYCILDLDAPGIYSFDRVDVKMATDDGSETESSIYKATVAPSFTCISKEPPVFVSYETDDYQFVPEGGATMDVVLQEADAAEVWAVMENTHGGITDTYLVKSKARDEMTDGSGIKFLFDVPTNASSTNFYVGAQDGQWTIKALCLQNVYIPGETEGEGTMYSTDTAPTLDNYNDGETCYVMNAENTENFDGNTTKVVQTVKVSAHKLNDAGKLEAYEGNVFGKTGDDVTGTFLEEHTESGVVLKLTDWAGEPVTVRDADADENDGILEFVWQITYNNDPSKYGYYTTDKASEGNRQINLTAEYDSAIGGYKVPNQSYQFSGTYNTTSVKFTYGAAGNPKTFDFMANTDTTDNLTVSYEVWSKKPTMTVSAVGPAATASHNIYLASRDGDDRLANSSDLVNGAFNRIFDTNADGNNDKALVYIYAGDSWALNAYLPNVKLSLSGIADEIDFTTSVSFANDCGAADVVYAFDQDHLSVTNDIGYKEDGVTIGIYTWQPIIKPAGTHSVSALDVTYDGVVYSVPLSEAVTIMQPQYPPYVDFVDIKSIDAEFDKTTPSRIYSTDGVTVTLPGSMTWQGTRETGDTSALVDDVSGIDPTDQNIYKYAVFTKKSGTISQHTHWNTYTVTENVYEAVTTGTKWTVTNVITEWTDGTNTYSLNETIELTGNKTLRPIISASSNGDEETIETTMIRYVITKAGINQDGTDVKQSWSSSPPSGYTEVSAAPTTKDTDWQVKK